MVTCFQIKMFKSGTDLAFVMEFREVKIDIIPAYMHVGVIWAGICNEGRLCFSSWWDPPVEVTTPYKPPWENSRRRNLRRKKRERTALLSLSWQCHIPIGIGEYILTPSSSTRERGQRKNKNKNNNKDVPFWSSALCFYTHISHILMCSAFTLELTPMDKDICSPGPGNKSTENCNATIGNNAPPSEIISSKCNHNHN